MTTRIPQPPNLGQLQVCGLHQIKVQDRAKSATPYMRKIGGCRICEVCYLETCTSYRSQQNPILDIKATMTPSQTHQQLQPQDSTHARGQEHGTAQPSDRLPRAVIKSLRQEARENTIKMRDLLRKAPT